MGGTSFDLCLIRDRKIPTTTESWVGDERVAIKIVEVETIGAGGGSIVWVDALGLIRVGPSSAGADPGPAAYGRSDLPTVTDADLVLGYLRPGLLPRWRHDAGPRPFRRRAGAGRSAIWSSTHSRRQLRRSRRQRGHGRRRHRDLHPTWPRRAFAHARRRRRRGGLHAAPIAERLGIPDGHLSADVGRTERVRHDDDGPRAGTDTRSNASARRAPRRRPRTSRSSRSCRTEAVANFRRSGSTVSRSPTCARSTALPGAVPRAVDRSVERRPRRVATSTPWWSGFHQTHEQLYGYALRLAHRRTARLQPAARPSPRPPPTAAGRRRPSPTPASRRRSARTPRNGVHRRRRMTESPRLRRSSSSLPARLRRTRARRPPDDDGARAADLHLPRRRSAQSSSWRDKS